MFNHLKLDESCFFLEKVFKNHQPVFFSRLEKRHPKKAGLDESDRRFHLRSPEGRLSVAVKHLVLHRFQV